MARFFSTHTLKQANKFIIIGGLSTLINYGVFFILFSAFEIHYLISAILGYIAGFIFGFIFNRSWTFVSIETKRLREFISYLLLYAASLALSMFFLKFLVAVIMLQPLHANIAAIGLSTTTNFLGCKIFIFKKAKL